MAKAAQTLPRSPAAAHARRMLRLIVRRKLFDLVPDAEAIEIAVAVAGSQYVLRVRRRAGEIAEVLTEMRSDNPLTVRDAFDRAQRQYGSWGFVARDFSAPIGADPSGFFCFYPDGADICPIAFV